MNVTKDFTVNGKCDVENCNSKCCTPVLLLSDSEIKIIKRYIKRNNIKAEDNPDSVCPFLNNDHRCNIYIHAPSICKCFMCNNSIVNTNFNFLDKKIIDMYKEFFPEEQHTSDINISDLNKKFTLLIQNLRGRALWTK